MPNYIKEALSKVKLRYPGIPELVLLTVLITENRLTDLIKQQYENVDKPATVQFIPEVRGVSDSANPELPFLRQHVHQQHVLEQHGCYIAAGMEHEIWVQDAFGSLRGSQLLEDRALVVMHNVNKQTIRHNRVKNCWSKEFDLIVFDQNYGIFICEIKQRQYNTLKNSTNARYSLNLELEKQQKRYELLSEVREFYNRELPIHRVLFCNSGSGESRLITSEVSDVGHGNEWKFIIDLNVNDSFSSTWNQVLGSLGQVGDPIRANVQGFVALMYAIQSIEEMQSSVLHTRKGRVVSKFRRPDTNEFQKVTKSNFTQFGYNEGIGKGSFGEVYIVKHIDSDTMVAIKTIDKLDMTRRFDIPTESFNREMSFLRKSSDWGCENIVRFYGYIQFGNYAWLILRLMDHDLSKVIAKLEYGNGCIKYNTGIWSPTIMDNLGYIMLKSIANGLRFVHGHNPEQDVSMHRDIKPSNIMIDKQGRKLAIIDFGSTKNIAEGMEMHSVNAGNPYYMAPECTLPKPRYDEKCDIWSVGITMITYLTGKHPIYEKRFDQSASTLSGTSSKIQDRITGYTEWKIELASDLFSKDFKCLINSCVIRAPEQRPSAAALYEVAAEKVEKLGEEAERDIFDAFLGTISS